MRPLCGCMHTYTSLYKSTDNYNKSETMYLDKIAYQVSIVVVFNCVIIA